MNKRIISLLLSLVMLMSISVTAVPTMAAEPIDLKVTADKTTANPGDTVSFAVAVGAVTDLAILEFQLKIPDGLTIIESSVALPEGIEETLDSDGAIVKPWTGSNWFWRYSAQSLGYTGTSDLVLVTFDCTVNADCAFEDKTITVEVESFYDLDFGEFTYTIIPWTLSVEKAPVAVTGVTVNETLSVMTGESKDLTVTVNPADATNKEVKFSVTSGSEFITVNANGKVTGVKAGVATVTVTTVDGDFSDTCTVTVACSHASKISTTAKDSDCKNKGWDAYSECDACGQIFDANGAEIAEIPYRDLSTQHKGGTATCTAQATCTVCGKPYGDTLDHTFTKEEKKADALKTAGDCVQEAVYIKSCTACGLVDTNTNNTFKGEKNPANHANYGTYIDGQAEADHKNGVDGYTGDVCCNGCDSVLTPGDPILAGAHTPANVWSNDANYHWKECTVTGCGIVIDGSKAEHKSEKAENKAACEKQAVCDVCGVAYGEIPHHEFTDEVIKDAALKTAGDCGKEAEYIKSCITCGEVDTDADNTFRGEKDTDNHANYGTYLDQYEPADHKNQKDGYTGDERCNSCKQILNPGQAIPAGAHSADDWSTDAESHWKECTVTGCGIIIDGSKAAHKSDKVENKAACGKQAVCDVCGVAYGETPEHDYGEEIAEENAEIGKDGAKAHYQCSKCEKYFIDVDNGTSTEKKEVSYDDIKIPALEDPDKVEIPETSDNNILWLCVAILCVGAAGFVAVTLCRKKNSVK